MKFLLLGAALCAGAGTGFSLVHLAAGEPAADATMAVAHTALTEPAGAYLDVRNATVFGGACHAGSEALTQGRNAILGWSIESGSHGGVDLTETRALVVLAAPGNLGLSGAGQVQRSSLLVIDAPTEPAADALEDWLRSRPELALGQVTEVRRSPITIEVDAAGTFLASAGELLETRGATLPDKECCSMPEQVWYGPLAGTLVSDPLVGFTEHAAFAGAGELEAWRHDGANTAFLGRFGPALVQASCCGVERPAQ